MNILMQPKATWVKPQMRITITTEETRIKYNENADPELLARMTAFANKVVERAMPLFTGKTLRGNVNFNLREATAPELNLLALRMGACWAAIRNQQAAQLLIGFEEMDKAQGEFTEAYKEMYKRNPSEGRMSVVLCANSHNPEEVIRVREVDADVVPN